MSKPLAVPAEARVIDGIPVSPRTWFLLYAPVLMLQRERACTGFENPMLWREVRA